MIFAYYFCFLVIIIVYCITTLFVVQHSVAFPHPVPACLPLVFPTMRFCSYIKYFLLYLWFYWIHPCFFLFISDHLFAKTFSFFSFIQFRCRFHCFNNTSDCVCLFVFVFRFDLISLFFFFCFFSTWTSLFLSFFVLYTYFHFCCVFLNLLLWFVFIYMYMPSFAIRLRHLTDTPPIMIIDNHHDHDHHTGLRPTYYMSFMWFIYAHVPC